MLLDSHRAGRCRRYAVDRKTLHGLVHAMETCGLACAIALTAHGSARRVLLALPARSFAGANGNARVGGAIAVAVAGREVVRSAAVLEADLICFALLGGRVALPVGTTFVRRLEGVAGRAA